MVYVSVAVVVRQNRSFLFLKIKNQTFEQKNQFRDLCASDRKFHKGRSSTVELPGSSTPILRLSFNKFQAGTNNRESTLGK